MKKFLFCLIFTASCAQKFPAVTQTPNWQGKDVIWNPLDHETSYELGFRVFNGKATTPNGEYMEVSHPICWSGYIYTFENDYIYYSFIECTHSDEFNKDAFLKESE